MWLTNDKCMNSIVFSRQKREAPPAINPLFADGLLHACHPDFC